MVMLQRQDCNDLKDNGFCSNCLTKLYGQIAKKCTIGAVRGAFKDTNCTNIPTFNVYFECATQAFVDEKCPDIAPQVAGSSSATVSLLLIGCATTLLAVASAFIGL
jgi:hypothetical protein